MANDPIFADLLGDGWEPAAPMTTQPGIWLGNKVPETSVNKLRWQLQIPAGTDARQEARRIVQAFDTNRWTGVIVSCELNGEPYDYVSISADKDIAGGWTSLGIGIHPNASNAVATAQMPVAADPEQRYPSNPRDTACLDGP